MSIKVTIDIPSLVKVIIDVIVRHYRVLKLIVTDQGLFFISKFLSLLCYFLKIKQKLSTAFFPQTNSQIIRQNNIWKRISEYLSIEIKIIGQSYCQWRNLPTTMRKILAPVTLSLSSIAATTIEFFSKKILIPT